MSGDAHDAAFDEDRGGPREPQNMISFPTNWDVHKSTKEVWPWQDAGAHSPGFSVVPSIFVEALFKKAPVPTPSDLTDHTVMTKCLDVTRYMEASLDLLVGEGLFHDEREDGSKVLIVFKHADELERRADRLT